jgi:hypothetical protein
VTLDGFRRPPDADRAITDDVGLCLGSEAGARVLAYLDSMTADVVLPSTASAQELAYHEGMRYMVAILKGRLKLSENPRE